MPAPDTGTRERQCRLRHRVIEGVAHQRIRKLRINPPTAHRLCSQRSMPAAPADIRQPEVHRTPNTRRPKCCYVVGPRRRIAVNTAEARRTQPFGHPAGIHAALARATRRGRKRHRHPATGSPPRPLTQRHELIGKTPHSPSPTARELTAIDAALPAVFSYRKFTLHNPVIVQARRARCGAPPSHSP